MRIILYRYHNNIDICKDRLSFIKKLNPDVPVYGMFGGKEEEYPDFDKELKPFFDGNYCISGKTDFWKWKNSDLAYRLWYKEYGHTIDFTSLVVLEWDLILFDSIENIYAHVKPGEAGLTGLVPLSKIEEEWFWIRDEEQRKFWEQLLAHVKDKYGFTDKPHGALCPGVCLPRGFLEKFAAEDVPELCHDELRLPLYIQVLGFSMVDNGFYKKWFSKREWKYFNCNNFDISEKKINRQLKKKNGRRVFHPFRELLFKPK